MAIKFTSKDLPLGDKPGKAVKAPVPAAAPKDADAVTTDGASELFPSLAKPAPKKRKSRKF